MSVGPSWPRALCITDSAAWWSWKVASSGGAPGCLYHHWRLWPVQLELIWSGSPYGLICGLLLLGPTWLNYNLLSISLFVYPTRVAIGAYLAVEHRLARLVQLGIRQSRYFGRVKTRFQLYLAATVANLTLAAGKSGLSDSVGGGAEAHRVVRSAVLSDVQAVSHGVVANATAIFGAVRLGILWTVILLKPALLPKSLSPTRAFRPGF